MSFHAARIFLLAARSFLRLSLLLMLAVIPALSQSRIPALGIKKGIQIGVEVQPGSRTPLWAVMVGDTSNAERIARRFSRLGPNGLNATIWTRETPDGWRKTFYRRPQTLDQAVEFFENAQSFTSQESGDESLLPLRLGNLQPDLLRQVDFVIRYDDGTAKAYLLPGTSPSQVADIMVGIGDDGAVVR